MADVKRDKLPIKFLDLAEAQELESFERKKDDVLTTIEELLNSSTGDPREEEFIAMRKSNPRDEILLAEEDWRHEFGPGDFYCTSSSLGSVDFSSFLKNIVVDGKIALDTRSYQSTKKTSKSREQYVPLRNVVGFKETIPVGAIHDAVLKPTGVCLTKHSDDSGYSVTKGEAEVFLASLLGKRGIRALVAEPEETMSSGPGTEGLKLNGEDVFYLSIRLLSMSDLKLYLMPPALEPLADLARELSYDDFMDLAKGVRTTEEVEGMEVYRMMVQKKTSMWRDMFQSMVGKFDPEVIGMYIERDSRYLEAEKEEVKVLEQLNKIFEEADAVREKYNNALELCRKNAAFSGTPISSRFRDAQYFWEEANVPMVGQPAEFFEGQEVETPDAGGILRRGVVKSCRGPLVRVLVEGRIRTLRTENVEISKAES